MGKPKAGISDGDSKKTGLPTKAGKKAKMYKEPPPVNLIKKRAKELGRKQFRSKEQLTAAGTKTVYDKKAGLFITKPIKVDILYSWDEDRKQLISSPTPDNDEWGD